MRRWIKFEEDVEEGGNRWSKPHVATLSLHSLFELRSLLLNGTVMLDMEAISLEQIADLVLDNMINKGVLPTELREKVRRRHGAACFYSYVYPQLSYRDESLRASALKREIKAVGVEAETTMSVLVERARGLKDSQSPRFQGFAFLIHAGISRRHVCASLGQSIKVLISFQVKEALLVRHRHQHERRRDNNMSKLPIIRSLAEIGRNHSSSKSKCRKVCPRVDKLLLDRSTWSNLDGLHDQCTYNTPDTSGTWNAQKQRSSLRDYNTRSLPIYPACGFQLRPPSTRASSSSGDPPREVSNMVLHFATTPSRSTCLIFFVVSLSAIVSDF